MSSCNVCQSWHGCWLYLNMGIKQYNLLKVSAPVHVPVGLVKELEQMHNHCEADVTWDQIVLRY